MLDYLGQHPTAAEILFVAHDVRVTSPKLKKKKINEEEFTGALSHFGSEYDVPTMNADDDIRSNIRYAQELMEKMKIN